MRSPRRVVSFILITILWVCVEVAAEEHPNMIVIKNTNDQPVGFMLTNMRPTTDSSILEGECAFVLLPKDAKLVDSELGIIISELKVAGEHACRMKISNGGIETWVTPKTLPSLSLTLDSEGKGTISTTEQGATRKIGNTEAGKGNQP